MSDRIAVMHEGRIQQMGSSREIYEYPSNRFVADFIGETNFLEGQVIESDKYTTLESGGVTFSGQGHQSLAKGTSATLAIRPEKIWLSPLSTSEARANGRVSLEGRISDAIYIGTDTRYQVKTSIGDTLFVRVQNLGQELTFQKGDTVSAQWSVEHAQVLTE